MQRYGTIPQAAHIGICQASDDREFVLYSDAMAEIGKKDKEIAELKAERDAISEYIHRFFPELSIIPHLGERISHLIGAYRATNSKLSRLTAALNDDKRAGKVADKKGCTLLGRVHRGEGITDFRADILKEVL